MRFRAVRVWGILSLDCGNFRAGSTGGERAVLLVPRLELVTWRRQHDVATAEMTANEQGITGEFSRSRGLLRRERPSTHFTRVNVRRAVKDFKMESKAGRARPPAGRARVLLLHGRIKQPAGTRGCHAEADTIRAAQSKTCRTDLVDAEIRTADRRRTAGMWRSSLRLSDFR